MATEEIRLYEMTFVLRQDIAAHEVHKIADMFVGILEKFGGSLVKKEYWGLRNLAYAMKKNRRGHYISFGISAPSAAVKELERNFKISEDVIKYLTIKVEKIDQEPSPMMQAPSDFSSLATGDQAN
jgi:small subunit ribosomal protein S6